MLRKNLAIIVSLEARSKMLYKKVFLKIFQCSQKKPSTGDLLFIKLQPEKILKTYQTLLVSEFRFSQSCRIQRFTKLERKLMCQSLGFNEITS